MLTKHINFIVISKSGFQHFFGKHNATFTWPCLFASFVDKNKRK
jgi:hypothetical protein